MLTSRFSAQKTEIHTFVHGAYGAAYRAILVVGRVLALCQTLGISTAYPHVAVDVGGLPVYYEDVKIFLELTSSYSNTSTFYHQARRVRLELMSRVHADLTVKFARLLRLLNCMFSPQLIRAGDQNPDAVFAFAVSRAGLHRHLKEVTILNRSVE